MSDDPGDAPSSQPSEEVPTKRSMLTRAKAEKDRVTRQVASTREQLEDVRHRSATVDAAMRAVEHDAEIGGGVLAAALGFRVFLFLVPYVFVFVAGFGVASSASGESTAEAAQDAGIGGLIAHTLGDFNRFSTWERVAALLVGLVALALASRSLVKTLAIVNQLVWRLEHRVKVNTSKAAAALVGMVTVALVLVALLGWTRGQSTLVGLLGTLLFIAVPFGLWLTASWLLPRDPATPWWALAPGAALVAVGIEALHLFTVYWIARSVASKSDTYGVLGAALAMLLWAYLLGRLLVGSAVLNSALWRRNVERRQQARVSREPPPGA